MRSGAEQFAADGGADPGLSQRVPLGCAVDRWAAEAGILLRADNARTGPVRVRWGAR